MPDSSSPRCTLWWIFSALRDGRIGVSRAERQGGKVLEHNPATVTREEAVEMWVYATGQGGVRERNPHTLRELYCH